jgi:NaMN:DMB phosphoribosyltransferase
VYGIIYAYERLKEKEFVKEIKGKNPTFVCVIATSETAKIPGISAAGKKS